MQPTLNSLYYGDCLDWMERWDDQTVDLVYLDPPFNSQANYNVLFGKAVGGAQYRAFTDTWQWDADAADRFDAYRSAIARPAHAAIVGLYSILGPSGMLSYLTYMAERLEHCHRLLKPTGSLYLHCDPTASHYLKLVMDAVFGHGNFRNEIVWCYRGGGAPRSDFGRRHDVILRYSVGQPYHFDGDAVRIPYEAEGQGRTDDSMWGRHRGTTKVYKPHPLGKIPEDWWPMNVLNANSPERTGYATQKPLALLRRIVAASSPVEGVVLDPFCGCGTTIAAARELGRTWVGIDISAFAIDLIRERLQDSSIPAYDIPYDLAGASKLAAEQPFAFETWAVTRLNGFVPNTKQVADGGVDGRGTVWEQPDADVTRLALAQVKGGHFSLGQLRDFNHVIGRDRAALGCYLTVDHVDTHAARTETTGMGTIRIGGMTYPRMQRWSMADYFNQLPPILPLMADPYTGKPMQMRLV